MNRVRVASRLRNIMRLMDKAFAMVRSWIERPSENCFRRPFFSAALTGITQTLRHAVDGQGEPSAGRADCRALCAGV